MAGELTLVLDRRALQVRLEGRAIAVRDPGRGDCRYVPLGLLRFVVVSGSPTVSCDVWRALAERGIPAVLLPARGSGRSAWVGAGLSASIRIRCCQHEAAADGGRQLAIVRRLLEMKIAAQLALARELAASVTGAAPADPDWRAGTQMAELVTRLEHALTALAGARDVPAMMGTEGAAASAWYGWLASALPARRRFAARNRRPPRDPVNALLSLGYTLATGEARRQIEIAGLDPGLGFLHGVVPGRDSLALDIVEPLRPGVDAFVLGQLDGPLVPKDFTYSRRDGCRLRKSARSSFFAAWSTASAAWPQLLFPRGATSGAGTVRTDDARPAPITLAGEARRIAHILRAELLEKEAGADPGADPDVDDADFEDELNGDETDG